MTTAPPPLPCVWDGERFSPVNPHWARQADKHFVVGAVYPLEVREDRSSASHRHYFAQVNETWQNLPDALAEQFPTAEHLRKWALIRAGFYDERSIACATSEDAERFAAFVKPMDDFAVVVVDENIVRVLTAKSQSLKAMGKADFQRSKEAVLDILAEMIGTTRGALSQAGEAA